VRKTQKRLGRPELPKGEVRDRIVMVRLNASELAKLDKVGKASARAATFRELLDRA
jgi:hypothetical protein